MAAEPVQFSNELGDEICDLVADGKTLREIEALDGMPACKSILRWARKHAEFGQQYARAREDAAHVFESKIATIANGVVADKDAAAAARVELAALTWLAGKRAPKVYGEKLTAELTGADGGPVIVKVVD